MVKKHKKDTILFTDDKKSIKVSVNVTNSHISHFLISALILAHVLGENSVRGQLIQSKNGIVEGTNVQPLTSKRERARELDS